MSADYDWDDDYDDPYPDDDYDDEPDYGRDLDDDYEPDPTDNPDFERYEHERYLRSLPPLRRPWEPVRAFIWRYTWHWRIRRSGGPFSDEPPF